jgi:putative ABC transport system permease protein
MLLGNAMNNNIVGLTHYTESMIEKSDLYYFLLTNGKSRRIALRPFIADAVSKGLNPLIAGTSVMGLISLPGMMTGQLLGGSSPATAIRYQIMIVVAIFIGCTINLVLSLLFTNLFAFDKYGRFRKDVVAR